MIANSTRDKNPWEIGAYLHGVGKANEHVYEFGGVARPGGIVIAPNLGVEGQTEPGRWAVSCTRP